MSEYEHSATVQAAADTVFQFVSDLNNLPRYLPTVQRAMPEQGERIRIEGEARGQHYEDDGFFRVDQQSQRMEWGSDGDADYSGWLTVEQQGDMRSLVTVHLSFGSREIPDQDQRIRQGLEDALSAIQQQIEARGGLHERAVEF